MATIEATAEQLAALDKQLNSAATPLAQRFRALFTLKAIHSLEAIQVIGKGELAADLGQA